MLVVTLHARDSLQRERSTRRRAFLPDLFQCRLGKQLHGHFPFHVWFESSQVTARLQSRDCVICGPEDKEALAANSRI